MNRRYVQSAIALALLAAIGTVPEVFCERAWAQAQQAQGAQPSALQRFGQALLAARAQRAANRYNRRMRYGTNYGYTMPGVSGGVGSNPMSNTRYIGGIGMGTTTAQQIGSMTYINGPAGSATAQQIGNMTYINGPGLSNATVQKVGNFGFINGSGGYSATSQRIGNMTFTNGSGGSSTATNVGNMTFVNGPGTRSGTIIRTGNTSFGNFNY